MRNDRVLRQDKNMLPMNAEKLEKTPSLVLIFVYDNNNMHANIPNIVDIKIKRYVGRQGV